MGTYKITSNSRNNTITVFVNEDDRKVKESTPQNFYSL